MKPTVRALLSLGLLAAVAQAENWPQWRGPFLNGSTTETDLPAEFSTTTNVQWAAPLPGPSGATPIVWDDRVFVSSPNQAAGTLLALCFDLASGRPLWSRRVGEDRKVARNNMASPSPIADGGWRQVYFYYGTGQLLAFDFDGKPLWRRDLEADHGHNALMFGYSSSPLLHDGTLYVIAVRNKRQDRYRRGPAGESDSYLLAVDPDTGEDLWKVVRPTDARDEAQETYSTAIPFPRDGATDILIFGADYLTAHDPATGAERWRWATYNPKKIHHWRTIPSPVVAGDIVFVPGPKHSTGFAIRPEGTGRLGQEHVAWTFEKHLPDASTPLVYQGRLYLLDDDRRVLTCLDPATGKPHWQGRLRTKAVIRASLTGADGKLYIISEKHEARVLAADRFEVLHRVDMATRSTRGLTRSSIVAAQGRLLVRTPDRLYCIAK
jgi:outer membrane protein assembly factor BamB